MILRTRPAKDASAGTSPAATAGTNRAATAIAALLGFALGLLALGPGLAPGFLLSYDMVFVPNPPFSAALVGASGGPARAVPSDAVITVAARVLPSDIVQKLILLLIFTAACAGAAALLAAGWQRAGKPAPVLACLVSGCFYVWNPFVAERLLIGQWALLLGYAGLPWVLREICVRSAPIRPGRLLIVMVPAAIGGFAAMTVTGLAAVPAALVTGTGLSDRARRLATVLATLALLSLPWLIPSLLVPVHTDPRGVDVFAARSDTPFGRLGSLVVLSGIWNSQTVPRGYGGPASFVWLLLVGCAVAGYLIVGWRRRLWPGLGLAGLIGLVVAAIGITSPTRAALRALVAASPGFAILRDGQQFVGALALTEAIGLGAGVAWLLSLRVAQAQPQGEKPAQPQGEKPAQPQGEKLAQPAGHKPAQPAGPKPVRPTGHKPGTEPAAVLIAVLAILAPVVLLPGMAWGMAGRIRPVEYPADWLAARQLIDGNSRPGSVVLLPWGAYRRFSWNGGEAVYDPWNKLLSREVVSDDGLQVGRIALSPESAASILVNAILARPGPVTVPLRRAGVRYVVIDAGKLLRDGPAEAAAQARLPGARTVLASRDLLVLELPGGS